MNNWDAIPLALLTQSYSRDFETEADDFAAHELPRAGLSAKSLSQALINLEKAPASRPEIPFFSYEPPSHDRTYPPSQSL